MGYFKFPELNIKSFFHFPTLSLKYILYLTLSILLANFVYSYFFIDNSPPVKFSNFNVITKKLRNGETFYFEFDFSKRHDCSPPLGKGEVEFRVWNNDNPPKFYWLYGISARTWPGQNQHKSSSVYMPNLPPGRYYFQFRNRHTCKFASDVIESDSPLLEFEIIDDDKKL